MRFLLPVVLCLPMQLRAQLQEVQIGLLRDLSVKRAIVVVGSGGAYLEVDGKRAAELKPNDGLRFEANGDALVAKSLSSSWSAKRSVLLKPKGHNSGFNMRSLDHKMADRSYTGLLEVRASAGRLRMVNEVPLEEYVAGVVSSEAGKDHHIEYYKLQAVICRTYALANLRKHAADGYELCDATHCQVYKGRARYAPILQAAHATHGMVVVDPDIRLIHATFHSNCGGETVNAEDVWSKPESYLRATADSFCAQAPHATWQRHIGRREWIDYLQRKYAIDTADDRTIAAITAHEPVCRELYLAGIVPLIPTEQVRDDWKLNSAWFDIAPDGDRVVLTGRGFGHGVGLCQEGAMRMAQGGSSFTEILHHYYTGVHLVDLSTLDFFRDEGR